MLSNVPALVSPSGTRTMQTERMRPAFRRAYAVGKLARPLPPITSLPKRALQGLLGAHYALSLFFFVALILEVWLSTAHGGYDLHGLRLFHVEASAPVSDGRLAFRVEGLEPGVPWLGLSIGNPAFTWGSKPQTPGAMAAHLLLGQDTDQRFELTIEGSSCEHSKPEAQVFNMTKLDAKRYSKLALLTRVPCREYNVTFVSPSISAASPRAVEGLQQLQILVETPWLRTAKVILGIRAFVCTVGLVLFALSLRTYARATISGADTHVGLRMVSIHHLGLVLACNPIEMVPITPIRLNFLSFVGGKMLVWSYFRFFSSLLEDLCRMPPCERLPTADDRWTKCALFLRAPPCVEKWPRLGMNVLPVLGIALATVAYARISFPLDVLFSEHSTVVPSHWRQRILAFVFGWKGFAAVVQFVVIWLTLFRVLQTIAHLNVYPFSYCSVHWISLYFFLAVASVGVLPEIAFLIRSGNLQYYLEREAPWLSMNDSLFDLFLPGSLSGVRGSFTEDSPGSLVGLSGHAFLVMHMSFSIVWACTFGGGFWTGGQEDTSHFHASKSEHASLVSSSLDSSVHRCSFQHANLTRVLMSTVRLMAHCSNAVYFDPCDEELLLELSESEKTYKLELPPLSLIRCVDNPASGVNVLVCTATLRGSQKLSVSDKRPQSIGIIAFRGTVSMENVKTDMAAWLTDPSTPGVQLAAVVDGIAGVAVHAGFNTAVQELLPLAMQAVDDLMEAGVDLIWLTGHSLGGAIATHMAVEIHGMRPELQTALCTFGSPAVGNAQFAELFSKSVGASVRVVNEVDPIVTGMDFSSYRHVAGLVRVFRNGHLMVRPSFLEEWLLWLTKRLNPTAVACMFLCKARRAQDHLMDGYITNLGRAEFMETRGRHDRLVVPTSFVRTNHTSAFLSTVAAEQEIEMSVR